jgi:hypothetical protein
MKPGQTFFTLKDNLPPGQSPNTNLVSAWRHCGGRLRDSSNFLDEVEQLADGSTRRTVTWTINGDVKVELAGETLSFEQFRARWISDEWREENQTHPITYMWGAFEMKKQAQDYLKGRRPHETYRRGNNVVRISPDETPERREKLLAQL